MRGKKEEMALPMVLGSIQAKTEAITIPLLTESQQGEGQSRALKLQLWFCEAALGNLGRVTKQLGHQREMIAEQLAALGQQPKDNSRSVLSRHEIFLEHSREQIKPKKERAAVATQVVGQKWPRVGSKLEVVYQFIVTSGEKGVTKTEIDQFITSNQVFNPKNEDQAVVSQRAGACIQLLRQQGLIENIGSARKAFWRAKSDSAQMPKIRGHRPAVAKGQIALGQLSGTDNRWWTPQKKGPRQDDMATQGRGNNRAVIREILRKTSGLTVDDVVQRAMKPKSGYDLRGADAEKVKSRILQMLYTGHEFRRDESRPVRWFFASASADSSEAEDDQSDGQPDSSSDNNNQGLSPPPILPNKPPKKQWTPSGPDDWQKLAISALQANHWQITFDQLLPVLKAQANYFGFAVAVLPDDLIENQIRSAILFLRKQGRVVINQDGVIKRTNATTSPGQRSNSRRRLIRSPENWDSAVLEVIEENNGCLSTEEIVKYFLKGDENTEWRLTEADQLRANELVRKALQRLATTYDKIEERDDQWWLTKTAAIPA